MRGNSFHQNSSHRSNYTAVEDKGYNTEESECVTYKTKEEYYLAEDELILPTYSEDQRHRRPSSPASRLSALDTLVISTHQNVSSKLCHAAAKIVRQADTLADTEVDEDDVLTVETVAYLLEDTDRAYSCRSGTSAELAGKFR